MSPHASPDKKLSSSLLRIVTYNIHKCRGLDRRVSPQRIAEVLGEIDADVIALQEVLSIDGARAEQHQAKFIAAELGMEFCLGENRRLQGGAYGNVTLSRLPILKSFNHDLTWRGRERRGCLQVDLRTASGATLRIFNVHLGTAFVERRAQGRKLTAEVLDDEATVKDATNIGRIMLGDFNEWTRGLTTRLLAEKLTEADVRVHLKRPRTYPGVLPVVHLDHIYYDAHLLNLRKLTLHGTRRALVASDHLPLIGDFQLNRKA